VLPHKRLEPTSGTAMWRKRTPSRSLAVERETFVATSPVGRLVGSRRRATEIAEGDMVATRATMQGTHLGTFMGVAPTNKQVTLTVLLMDQVVNGKIVLHYANADWIGVLVKLGALPPPPGMTKSPA
jgi:hypothetical protein